MGKVTVKHNKAGYIELMNSSQMQAILREQAEQVAARAGDGFEVSVQPGKNRAHARVNAATWEAVARNRKHNTLLKALGGGA